MSTSARGPYQLTASVTEIAPLSTLSRPSAPSPTDVPSAPLSTVLVQTKPVPVLTAAPGGPPRSGARNAIATAPRTPALSSSETTAGISKESATMVLASARGSGRWGERKTVGRAPRRLGGGDRPAAARRRSLVDAWR